MPRKISTAERARWLEDYERGVTETQIAGKARSDKRTVKDNLQLAMMERAAVTARVEIIKATALNHQNDLLGSLRELKQSLTSHVGDWTPVTWYCERGQDMRGIVQVALVHVEKRGSPEDEHGNQETPSVQGLLLEHLKRDPLPKLLMGHSQRRDDYERALLSLQFKTVDTLEAETGLKLMMGPTSRRKSFMYCYTAGDMAFGYALKQAFSPPGEAPPLPEIVVWPDQGEVRWGGGQILAVARGREKAVKKGLTATLSALARSTEVQQVRATRNALREMAERARIQAEELLLLGFVAGECRVCRRLGLWTPGGLRR